MDITWFPFDDQDCDLKFGSWTYSGWKVGKKNINCFEKKPKRRFLNCFVKFFSQLDLVLQSEEGGDLSGFMPNGENSEDNDDDDRGDASGDG